MVFLGSERQITHSMEVLTSSIELNIIDKTIYIYIYKYKREN